MLKVLMDGVDFSGGFFAGGDSQAENLTKAHAMDAGLDLHANEDVVIDPGGRALVGTGIQVEILPGYVGLIFARSGLAVHHGIVVGAGVVDATYRGEVKVLLFNFGTEAFHARRGDRIAQLITVPVNLGRYDRVDFLSDTPRGGDGFGSSGR